LVIADQSGPLAMAGIMGGENSGVSTQTRDIFLECAFFSPLAVAGRARRFGLHTDASHRYERGVDHDIQALAMERATQLLLEICGGAAGPVTVAVGVLPPPVEVTLALAKVEKILGTALPLTEIKDILSH